VGRHRVAVLVAGVVGAVSVPVGRSGIGWPVAALAVIGTVALLRRDERPERARSDRLWRVATTVAAGLLVAVAAIRAAEWFVALCLVVAVPLAAAGMAGGRGWFGLVRATIALPLASARGLASLAPATRSAPGDAPPSGPPSPGPRSAGSAATGATKEGEASQTPGPARAPSDTAQGPAPAERAPSNAAPALRIAAAIAVGALLVLVFGALFAAADPAFARLVRGWYAGVSVADVARILVGFALVVGLAVGLAHVRASAPSTGDEPRRRLGAPEWAIPIAMLDILFGVFVWVQITVLFGGEGYVLGPGGPDYAQYARGGFVQLVWVTVLTLGVLAALAVWARRDTPGERALLRGLAGALCVLTLVVVTSALKRMGLYAEAYGFTIPRLLGYVVEAWLGLVFALVIVAGVRLRAAWLPRATVAVGVALLLALATVNPEALMARTLLTRLDGPYQIDRYYLASLSADAIETIDRVPEPERSCLLARLAHELERPDPWYGLNLARERARALIARKPVVVAAAGCVHLGDPKLPVAR
jgi:hypothetical protein